jgi:hypothetical protein
MSLASDTQSRPARTRPLSQVEIEVGIAQTTDLLEQAVEDYEDARVEAAQTDVTYRLDLARAKLAVRASTIPEREARALLTVEPQFRHAKIAEAKADSLKAAKDAVSDRLSALQTLLRSVTRQT